MKKNAFFLTIITGTLLFITGCGASQQSSTTRQNSSEDQPPPKAMEYYNYYMSQAGIAQSEEKIDEALDNYIQAADALNEMGRPCLKKADAHYEAAQMAYQLVKKDLAIKQYEAAVNIYIHFTGNSLTKAAVCYTNLGVVYKELHNNAKARTAWQQARTLYNSLPKSDQNAGNIEKINQNIRDLDEGF